MDSLVVSSFEVPSSIPWKTSWSCFLGTLVDFANSGALGGAPSLYDALNCFLDPEGCIYDPPDWSDNYSVSGRDSLRAEYELSGGTYSSHLSPDGLFRVCLRKSDDHQFSHEGSDTFDSASYVSVVNGVTSVKYTYIPSIPVVGVVSIVDELGYDVSLSETGALTHLPIELEAGYCNAGNQAPHTVSIDWGDGCSEDLGTTTGAIHTSHVYDTPGQFPVVLAVADEYGNSGETVMEITVSRPRERTAAVGNTLVALGQDPDVMPAARSSILKAVTELVGNNDGKAQNGAIAKLEQGNWTAALQMLDHALKYLQIAAVADPDIDLSPERDSLVLIKQSVAHHLATG
jgi:hypothetical protein